MRFITANRRKGVSFTDAPSFSSPLPRQSGNSSVKAAAGSFEAGSLEAAREQALKYLDLREHSEREISDKLALKGYSPEIIRQTVSELSLSGALSNRRFAAAFVSSRRRRGEGDRIISMRLAEKGISRELCTDVLSADDGSVSSSDALGFALSKALRRYSVSDPRLFAYMQRKGFSVSEVKRYLALRDS